MEDKQAPEAPPLRRATSAGVGGGSRFTKWLRRDNALPLSRAETGPLRGSAKVKVAPRAALKSVVSSAYEHVFEGHEEGDIVRCWDEFWLLKADCAHILHCLSSLSEHELCDPAAPFAASLPRFLARAKDVACDAEAHTVRRTRAFETLAAFLRGILCKHNYENYAVDTMGVLCGEAEAHKAQAFLKELVTACITVLEEESTTSDAGRQTYYLKTAASELLKSVVCSQDATASNTLLELPAALLAPPQARLFASLFTRHNRRVGSAAAGTAIPDRAVPPLRYELNLLLVFATVVRYTKAERRSSSDGVFLQDPPPPQPTAFAFLDAGGASGEALEGLCSLMSFVLHAYNKGTVLGSHYNSKVLAGGTGGGTLAKSSSLLDMFSGLWGGGGVVGGAAQSALAPDASTQSLHTPAAPCLDSTMSSCCSSSTAAFVLAPVETGRYYKEMHNNTACASALVVDEADAAGLERSNEDFYFAEFNPTQRHNVPVPSAVSACLLLLADLATPVREHRGGGTVPDAAAEAATAHGRFFDLLLCQTVYPLRHFRYLSALGAHSSSLHDVFGSGYDAAAPPQEEDAMESSYLLQEFLLTTSIVLHLPKHEHVRQATGSVLLTWVKLLKERRVSQYFMATHAARGGSRLPVPVHFFTTGKVPTGSWVGGGPPAVWKVFGFKGSAVKGDGNEGGAAAGVLLSTIDSFISKHLPSMYAVEFYEYAVDVLIVLLNHQIEEKKQVVWEWAHMLGKLVSLLNVITKLGLSRSDAAKGLLRKSTALFRILLRKPSVLPSHQDMTSFVYELVRSRDSVEAVSTALQAHISQRGITSHMKLIQSFLADLLRLIDAVEARVAEAGGDDAFHAVGQKLDECETDKAFDHMFALPPALQEELASKRDPDPRGEIACTLQMLCEAAYAL